MYCSRRQHWRRLGTFPTTAFKYPLDFVLVCMTVYNWFNCLFRVLVHFPLTCSSASVFKIKQNTFLDALIQNRFFNIIKTNDFRGDLTDILAKKEALKSSNLYFWSACYIFQLSDVSCCSRWAVFLFQPKHWLGHPDLFVSFFVYQWMLQHWQEHEKESAPSSHWQSGFLSRRRRMALTYEMPYSDSNYAG